VRSSSGLAFVRLSLLHWRQARLDLPREVYRRSRLLRRHGRVLAHTLAVCCLFKPEQPLLEKPGQPGCRRLGVHQFNTTCCPAVTVAGRMLLPSLTEYFPAGKETGWLTCLDASCVPEASSTA
jgi:hypothetical protein